MPEGALTNTNVLALSLSLMKMSVKKTSDKAGDRSNRIFFKLKKKKCKSLKEIYRETRPLQEKPSVDLHEEGLSLSPLVRDIECPTLSPSRPNSVEIPSSSMLPSSPHWNEDSSSSEMSNIDSIPSPSTERQVCEAQHSIEEEV